MLATTTSRQRKPLRSKQSASKHSYKLHLQRRVFPFWLGKFANWMLGRPKLHFRRGRVGWLRSYWSVVLVVYNWVSNSVLSQIEVLNFLNFLQHVESWVFWRMEISMKNCQRIMRKVKQFRLLAIPVFIPTQQTVSLNAGQMDGLTLRIADQVKTYFLNLIMLLLDLNKNSCSLAALCK